MPEDGVVVRSTGDGLLSRSRWAGPVLESGNLLLRAVVRHRDQTAFPESNLQESWRFRIGD
jgi:hypothetical protein